MQENKEQVFGLGSVSAVVPGQVSTLEGVTEHQFVTVHNPLPGKFVGRVAQTSKVNAPGTIVNDPRSNGGVNATDEMLSQAGINIKKLDQPGRLHTIHEVEIGAGQSKNLRGDEAKVIVRQLVDAYLSFTGQVLKVGNPAARAEAEEKIVLRVTDMNAIMDEYKTRDELAFEAIEKTNTESAFPGLKQEVKSVNPKSFELNGITFEDKSTAKAEKFLKNGKEIPKNEFDVALGQYNVQS